LNQQTGKLFANPARFRPITIAIVGADGSGKTSIAKALLASGIVPMKYLYLGPAIGSSNHALPTSRLIAWLRRRNAGNLLKDGVSMPPAELMSPEMAGKLRRGPLLKALGLVNRVAEEWYRQLLAWTYRMNGYSVLCDRHYLFEYCPDSTSTRTANTMMSQRLHNWLLAKFYPAPDLVLFLDAPAHVLHARKPEWTPEYLNRQRSRILEQGAVTGNFSVIDAEQPFATVLAAVTARLASAPAATATPLRAQAGTD
jgi:thymidylate kinase